MNPDTGKFEKLYEMPDGEDLSEHVRRVNEIARGFVGTPQLLRADGTPVPDHWSVFTPGEKVVIKNYTYEVVDISSERITFKPVGPAIIGNDSDVRRRGGRFVKKKGEKKKRGYKNHGGR